MSAERQLRRLEKPRKLGRTIYMAAVPARYSLRSGREPILSHRILSGLPVLRSGIELGYRIRPEGSGGVAGLVMPQQGATKPLPVRIMPKSIPTVPLTAEAVSRAIFSPPETARVLDLSLPSIYNLKAAGRLPAIVDGNGRLVAFLRVDILPLVGGLWRKKPGRKNNLNPAKTVKGAGHDQK